MNDCLTLLNDRRRNNFRLWFRNWWYYCLLLLACYLYRRSFIRISEYILRETFRCLSFSLLSLLLLLLFLSSFKLELFFEGIFFLSWCCCLLSGKYWWWRLSWSLYCWLGFRKIFLFFLFIFYPRGICCFTLYII